MRNVFDARYVWREIILTQKRSWREKCSTLNIFEMRLFRQAKHFRAENSQLKKNVSTR